MPRHITVAVFLLAAAAANVAAEPPRDPNPDRGLPPLGCRHNFPAHAWCRKQLTAANAFRLKCERVLEGARDRGEVGRWLDLHREARRSCEVWFYLTGVQDPANGLTEGCRRRLLRYLFDHLGPDAFHAGRMPPPVPPGAPVD